MSSFRETKFLFYFLQETCQLSRLSVEENIIFRLLWTEAEPFVYRKRLEKTNEGQRRETRRMRERRGMRKKKNSPLVPGISVAYRWHENVAFGFFQVTSKRKVLSSPAHPLLGRSGRSLVGLWLIEANDFFSLSLSASLFFFF